MCGVDRDIKGEPYTTGSGGGDGPAKQCGSPGICRHRQDSKGRRIIKGGDDRGSRKPFPKGHCLYGEDPEREKRLCPVAERIRVSAGFSLERGGYAPGAKDG